MTERPDNQRRIDELERKLALVEARLSSRDVASYNQPQLLIAQTAGEQTQGGDFVEGDYPSDGNTFGIKFREATFTEEVGDQKLEGEFGKPFAQRIARTIPGRYVAQGSDVLVAAYRGKYYILGGTDVQAYVVQLDRDLDKAETKDVSGVTCVTPSSVSATIWAYDETEGAYCPTVDQLIPGEDPDGVYNVQTDKEFASEKDNGDPNLIIVWKEAASDRFVPFCCGDEGEPGVTSPLACGCFSVDAVCRVWLAIGLVRTIQDPFFHPEHPDPQWPHYCWQPLWVEDDYRFTPCSSCGGWNQQWPLFPEDTTTPTNDCRFGVKNLGNSQVSEPWREWRLFPCHQEGDNGLIVVTFNHPTCDTATLDFINDGCSAFVATFDTLDFGIDEPSGTDATNRVSMIAGLEEGRCWCRIIATRKGNIPADGFEDLDLGTWDPTNVPPEPDLQHGTGTPCAWYVADGAGTHDFGDGNVNIAVGDIVIYDGPPINKWKVISAAARNNTFLPCEIIAAVDKHGCDWGTTFREAALVLQFEQCSPAPPPPPADVENIKTLTSADSPYTVTSSDVTLLCDCTGGSITINLPKLVVSLGRRITAKKTDVSANTATLDGDGSETIDGSLTKVLSSQYDSSTIQAGTAEWHEI